MYKSSREFFFTNGFIRWPPKLFTVHIVILISRALRLHGMNARHGRITVGRGITRVMVLGGGRDWSRILGVLVVVMVVVVVVVGWIRGSRRHGNERGSDGVEILSTVEVTINSGRWIDECTSRTHSRWCTHCRIAKGTGVRRWMPRIEWRGVSNAGHSSFIDRMKLYRHWNRVSKFFKLGSRIMERKKIPYHRKNSLMTHSIVDQVSKAKISHDGYYIKRIMK